NATIHTRWGLSASDLEARVLADRAGLRDEDLEQRAGSQEVSLELTDPDRARAPVWILAGAGSAGLVTERAAPALAAHGDPRPVGSDDHEALEPDPFRRERSRYSNDRERAQEARPRADRKSTRLNSSHVA